MKLSSKVLLTGACLILMVMPQLGVAQSQEPASSAIQKQSNGFWLYVDGVQTPAFGGVVYQNTEGDMHILAYSNSLHSLYSPLDEEAAGGSGHGARLGRMGVYAIRVYELPVENADDARHVKAIFRRLYDNYHIKVLIGDWAGLHQIKDFGDTNQLAGLYQHISRLVTTYCDERWVLGWQLGNENNYYTRNGLLGHDINLNAAEYYKLMDGLAGVVKAGLGKRHITQFVSLGQGDLTTNEAALIASMTNIDAVGINCYRGDQSSFDALISLAAERIKRPIYFAEVGKPADDEQSQEEQSRYLRQVCSTVFADGAGRVGTGNVLGVFINEATDEAWKRYDRGQESDAHFGIFGKKAEQTVGALFKQTAAFSKWVLPTNDAPDTLIHAAWGCLEGPYARQYGREFGYAMVFATRAITLYQSQARAQQAQLLKFKSPPEVAASTNFWALNTVGTGYFILGDAWMLMSYNFQGAERPRNFFDKLLQLADYRPHDFISPGEAGVVIPTNSVNCVFYAQQVFNTLHTQYPYAHLREVNGNYWSLDHAVKTRFPELSPPYIPLTWQNAAIFVGAGFFVLVGLASFGGWSTKKRLVKTEPVLSRPQRLLFLAALVLDLACFFWFVSWWFDPVRIEYYTVKPALFWVLTSIGSLGVLMYFYFWYLLWNMRRPVPMKAPAGLRVAMVTTRVASESVESFEQTLEKMSLVAYPHDSYLLDEEDNSEARLLCEKWNVIHFSRKGKMIYNQSSGKFQARTKGGNLNSWLYEFGTRYEFVTFLDPDHLPHPNFLDRVLGYFSNPHVAFVQAPQVLYNYRDNWVTRGAAEQSYFFYGPVQMGLFGIGACVVNGSHSTFRIKDLFSIREESYAVHDADDILTSMRIHAARKLGVYVPEVLAEGLAPDTWVEFAKQQRRWAYSMFQLFFHYYLSELRRMPWRCKLIYLVMAFFYFRGVAFAGLILLPFISVMTGNPPVNAHITAFCLRYLPFFLLNCGILVAMGQCFLIPGGGRKGFWYHAGILWVAMWWEHLGAMVKGLLTRRVGVRIVAAKWKTGTASPWYSVRPHLLLIFAAAVAFTCSYLHEGRRETIWGTLLFLGIIILSQGWVVFKVVSSSKHQVLEEQPVRETAPIPMTANYSQQPQSKL